MSKRLAFLLLVVAFGVGLALGLAFASTGGGATTVVTTGPASAPGTATTGPRLGSSSTTGSSTTR